MKFPPIPPIHLLLLHTASGLRTQRTTPLTSYPASPPTFPSPTTTPSASSSPTQPPNYAFAQPPKPPKLQLNLKAWKDFSVHDHPIGVILRTPLPIAYTAVCSRKIFSSFKSSSKFPKLHLVEPTSTGCTITSMSVKSRPASSTSPLSSLPSPPSHCWTLRSIYCHTFSDFVVFRYVVLVLYEYVSFIGK